MTMAKVGGGTFDVSQFDAGLSYYTNETSFLATLTGHIFGGGTVTDTFTVGDGFATYAFGDLTDLTSLDWTAPADGYIAVDNIGTNIPGGVPEPATWSMMLLGVALIGGGLRVMRGRDTVALAEV